MRRFTTVAIVAAVAFAAPSQAGNYGHGHKSDGHKSHYKSYGHSKRWNPYGGKVVIKFGFNHY